MDIDDTVKSLFGGDEESEESFEAAFEQEALLPDTAETTLGREEDTRELVESGLGAIESLARKIPGYQGYKEKELRREADKVLRLQVAGKLDDQRRRLSGLQLQLVDGGQIESAAGLERAVKKLQLLIDRIKTASYGYAGLFDAVKIKEEQLDALYRFDAGMLDSVEEIAEEVDYVASAVRANEGIAEATASLVTVTEKANRDFGHREEAILQASAWE